MEEPELSQADLLAVDIDVRLADHWPVWTRPGSALAVVMGHSQTIGDAVGAIARTAYAQGYTDALREDKAGRRAELHRTHGFRPE